MNAENADLPGGTAGAEEEVTPLFAAFKPKPKPAPRPVPAPAPAPAPANTEAPLPAPKPRQEPEKPQASPAMEARLAELEKKLLEKAAPAPEKEALEYLKAKVGELEAKLRESQEKGLAFAFELKGREESRKESRREMEELLATMKQQQSAGETERLRLEEIGKSRARIEALEKRLLDLAADAGTPKQDPAQQERLEALAARLASLESAVAAQAERFSADSKVFEEKSARYMNATAERMRNELVEVLVIKLREFRSMLLEEAARGMDERMRQIPDRIDKSSSAMAEALAARLAELREAAALLSDTAVSASVGGDKAFEWVKETLEKKGRTAVDYAAGAYDIGFIQASLDNLEKSLASALETVSRTSQAAEETALPPETRARRGATALAEAMKRLGDALDNFRHMRFEITKKIRKTLTGD
jgi:hypothetical protein